MTVVFALLVLAVVVVGVVIVLQSPAPAPPPAEPTVAGLLPAPIAAADLRRVRFPVVFRGYRMDDVDALLARLATQLEPPAPTGPPVIGGMDVPR